MEKFEGKLQEIKRSLKKKQDTWFLPNLYKDKNGNTCFDIGNNLQITSIQDLNEYAALHRDAMAKIHELYKGVIMGLYREKFSNLTYYISPRIKLMEESRAGKELSVSKLGSLREISGSDAVTFGYIVDALKNIEFKPYRQMSEVMQGNNIERYAGYLFPVFTENGIKTVLNGRNLETQFKLISNDEAEELREILSAYTEQIATENRISREGTSGITYTPYQEIVDKLFNAAQTAGRALQLHIQPTEKEFAFGGKSEPEILFEEMRRMERLSQLIFSPDLTKMARPSTPAVKKPRTERTVEEPSLVERIIMDGEYSSKPALAGDGKIVVVLTPTAEGTEFKLVHDGKNLEVSQTSGEQKGE